MTTRRIRRQVAAAAAVASAVLPVAASAQTTGGAQFGADAIPGASGTAIVGTSAFYARPQVLSGSTLRFYGTAPPGAIVQIERLASNGLRWTPTATVTAGLDGAFVAPWKTGTDGVFTVHAVISSMTPLLTGTSESIDVAVFKRAKATWYGPGLYGKKTACGVKLTTTLVGVAHRTLPCGQTVAVRYRGRTVLAPVVDRGPYDHGATWDLTEAAAKALGFTVTDKVDVVRLPVAKTAKART